jgi:hypothetical protein
MNITIRSMLEELGLKTEEAIRISRLVAEARTNVCEEETPAFLVVTSEKNSFWTFMQGEPLDLKGMTPCLVFEIGKEERDENS